jgi:hypothetical protein
MAQLRVSCRDKLQAAACWRQPPGGAGRAVRRGHLSSLAQKHQDERPSLQRNVAKFRVPSWFETRVTESAAQRGRLRRPGGPSLRVTTSPPLPPHAHTHRYAGDARALGLGERDMIWLGSSAASLPGFPRPAARKESERQRARRGRGSSAGQRARAVPAGRRRGAGGLTSAVGARLPATGSALRGWRPGQPVPPAARWAICLPRSPNQSCEILAPACRTT